MAEPFHTRIPTLSDAELKEYIAHYSKYRLEAVEAAANELRRRGHPISRDELNTIRENILTQNDHTPNTLKRLATHAKSITVILLAVGLSSSLLVYLTAGPVDPNPLGYDPLDTKKYLRELEVYGGKGNLLLTQFREWFGGLWHGKPLAFTLFFLTAILAFLFWFLGAQHSSGVEAEGGIEKNHQRIKG
jgi:hypothetical protein